MTKKKLKKEIKKYGSTEVLEEPIIPEVKKTSGIGKMEIDFTSEGLNNIARKINEIVDYLDAL